MNAHVTLTDGTRVFVVRDDAGYTKFYHAVERRHLTTTEHTKHGDEIERRLAEEKVKRRYGCGEKP